MEPNTPPTTITALIIAPNSWGHKKIKLKNKFGRLSDADLHYEPGKEQELSERLQARLDLGPDQLHRLINDL